MPVRATILARVDPFAGELQRIGAPHLVAAGLVLWAGGALIAACLAWLPRLSDIGEVLWGTALRAPWAGAASSAALLASALGAVALVRPHAGIRRRNVACALAALAAYVPLALVHRRIMLGFEPVRGSPYFPFGSADVDRLRLRLLEAALLLVIVLGLRLNARLLAARSLVMRTGRADRQTMLGLAAAVGIAALGDAMRVVASLRVGWLSDALDPAGVLLVGLGSMLFTVGLAGLLVDALRLAPVVIEPAPSLSDVFEPAASVPPGSARARNNPPHDAPRARAIRPADGPRGGVPAPGDPGPAG